MMDYQMWFRIFVRTRNWLAHSLLGEAVLGLLGGIWAFALIFLRVPILVVKFVSVLLKAYVIMPIERKMQSVESFFFTIEDKHVSQQINHEKNKAKIKAKKEEKGAILRTVREEITVSQIEHRYPDFAQYEFLEDEYDQRKYNEDLSEILNDLREGIIQNTSAKTLMQHYNVSENYAKMLRRGILQHQERV